MKSDVFVSYASGDRERVYGLVERLRAAGVSVWIDQIGIEGASMWSQEIVEAIDKCKVLILAISQRSTESENVVKELALASERRKNILPVCLDLSGIPKSMEYQLAGIQRVEYLEGKEAKGIEAINRALDKLDVTFVDGFGQSHEGEKQGKQARRSNQTQGNSSSLWPKALVALSSLAVLAICLFLSGVLKLGPQAPSDQSTKDYSKDPNEVADSLMEANRVAVLPFKTLGASGETSDLGFGLVSTLTSKLQPIEGLTIIAKESARKFIDSNLSPKEIGQALGAGTLVTGEIQTSTEKVQVNIQLIDANTENLGWGSVFIESKNDFLDLQTVIATHLVSELKGSLDDASALLLSRKATEIPEADAAYQKGRQEWNKRTPEGFYNAIKLFEKATQLDPNYADPYAGLADTYGLMPSYNLEPALEVMPKAKLNAEKAIELDPRSSAGYASLAWAQFTYEYDWEIAENYFETAIQLNPNYANAYLWFGILKSTAGLQKEAITYLRKALELDPTSLIIPTNLAAALRLDGQEDEALGKLNAAFKINRNFPAALNVYALCEPDYNKAIGRLRSAIEADPSAGGNRVALFRLYVKTGNLLAAKDQMIYLLDHFHSKLHLGFSEMYAHLGSYDEALRWLEKGINEKESIVSTGTNHDFPKEFVSDMRFLKLMDTLSHPLYKK
ncbi:MAG: hypothetical protein CMK36_09495 [Porticoccaceae bacterium]|nr:hypothetical protein [Porticoccaceae bacterium]